HRAGCAVKKDDSRGFRYHEHTADITIECWAATLEEAFEEAALAAFEVIVDTTTVEPRDRMTVAVEGIDLEELLVEWIGQLIAMIDLNNQFYSKFKVRSIVEGEPWRLEAEVWGETIDYQKHDIHTEVKAMTYADLKIERSPERTTLWFTLDL
ncbi:MAG: archease, partial [Candidatus Thorarchaeota archaeon]